MYIPCAAMGRKTLFILFTAKDAVARQFLQVPFGFPLQRAPARRHRAPRPHLCSALWSPAECEEIGHRGRATSWKHVISIWLLLIEDVSAVEWVMTQEPSCSAADGLQTPSAHADTHNAHLSLSLYSFCTRSLFFFTTLN